MMYNMTTPGLLGVAESGATPRTPEILNSLISMTNPFDRLRTTANSPQSEASNSPPSVQHTCSQLIKEGLKLTIQSKRRTMSGSEGSPLLGGRSTGGNTSPESLHCDTSNDGLTPEDEERRRRRRERNKIAATKCRQKKRERTNNLVYESEALETQNHDLKSKIQELENQRRKLVDILAVHRPNCNKQPFASSSSAVYHEYSRADYSTGGYPSTSYEVCSESSSTASYHRQTVSTATVIEEIGYPNAYLYKERALREQLNPYSRPEMQSDDILRSAESGGYPILEAGRHYPLQLAASTSSSDYESNTELLDSPSASYQFPDDPSSYSSSSSSVFPASSCIT